jgi:hypothetical protein
MELTCQSCQSKTTVADDAIGDVTCSSCGKPLEMSRPDVGGVPAARREKGRGADQDLFGSVAKAGSEDEPVKPTVSAAAAPASSTVKAAKKDDAKLTGERNESSVLFSLGSLTKEAEKEKEKESGNAKGDGSGLIDIRSLAGPNGPLKNEGSKKSVDDIMNLGGGGGAFGTASPMLAAPAPEVLAASAEPAAQPSGGSKNGIIFAILGGAAFLTIGVVAALVLTRKPDATEPPAERTGKTETAPSSTGAGTGTAKVDPTATATATTTAATSATPPGTATVAAKDPTGTPAHTATGGTGNTAPTAKPTTTVAANTAAPTATGPAPTAAPPKPVDDGSGKPPFNRGEATAALGAVNISSCKKPDGPTGNGHVVVTFDPSGSVQSAVVDDGPYPGTPVGGCIAGKFRGPHVSPFSGSSVKVGKSFSL